MRELPQPRYNIKSFHSYRRITGFRYGNKVDTLAEGDNTKLAILCGISYMPGK